MASRGSKSLGALSVLLLLLPSSIPIVIVSSSIVLIVFINNCHDDFYPYQNRVSWDLYVLSRVL